MLSEQRAVGEIRQGVVYAWWVSCSWSSVRRAIERSIQAVLEITVVRVARAEEAEVALVEAARVW